MAAVGLAGTAPPQCRDEAPADNTVR